MHKTKVPTPPALPKAEMALAKVPKLPDPRQAVRKLQKPFGKAQGMWGKWAQKVKPTKQNGGRPS